MTTDSIIYSTSCTFGLYCLSLLIGLVLVERGEIKRSSNYFLDVTAIFILVTITLLLLN